MKATGIVRRIDDLGRVVIPKEIRRTLRIREGDPLEIFTDREGEDHPEKIFSDRGIGNVCCTVLRESGTDTKLYGMYNRLRSSDSSEWEWKKGL